MSSSIGQWRAAIGVFNSCFRCIREKISFLPTFKNSKFKCLNFILNVASLLVILLLSPFLCLFCSLFEHFPLLKYTTSYFYYCNDLKFIFRTSLILVRITVYFSTSILTHFLSSPSFKHDLSCFLNHAIILLSLFLYHYIHLLLFQCGDIERNPGPTSFNSKNLSVCHWNLNSLTAHNFGKIALLEAYIL